MGTGKRHRLRSLWGRVSIRTKLAVIVLATVAAATSAIAIFSYAAARKSILDQAYRESSAYLSQVVFRMDLFLQTVQRGLIALAYNKDVIRAARTARVDRYDMMQAIDRIYGTLSAFSETGRIRSLTFLNFRSGTYLTSNGTKGRIDGSDVNLRAIKSAVDRMDPQYTYEWIETRPIDSGAGDHQPRYALSVVTPVNYWEHATVEAVMVADIDEDTLAGYYGQELLGVGTRVLVTNPHGVVISSGRTREIGRTLAEVLGKNADATLSQYVGTGVESGFLVTSQRSPYTGWTVHAVMPVHSLIGASAAALALALCIGVGIALAGGFAVLFMVNRCMYRPVKELVDSVKRDEDDREMASAIDSRPDEIGQLFRSFHEFHIERRRLLQNDYRQRLLVKDAEIRLLSSQIDSHFLYNTLSSISWLAKARNFRGILTVVNALVVFLRVNQDRGDGLITVGKAAEQIQAYLTIQRVRYSDRLAVEVDMDPSIEGELVPKLLLQPIVENAVCHGIEKKRGEGRIQVNAGPVGPALVFTVTDNGVGMSAGRLDEIRGLLASVQRRSDQFSALQNISHRLRILYGAEASLELSSTPGVGTSVKVTLPSRQIREVLPA